MSNHQQIELPLSAAMERAETGMQRAVDHANRVESEWSGQALGLLVAFAKQSGRPFLIEEARAYAEQNGLPLPPDARSWGAVMDFVAVSRHLRRGRRRTNLDVMASLHAARGRPLWACPCATRWRSDNRQGPGKA